MTMRRQLAALLGNEQAILSVEAVNKMAELAALLSDKLPTDKPAQEGFIRIGMDWFTLEVGQVYALPEGKWRGQNQLFFQDASDHMRKHGGQFEFGGAEGSHWVKRTK